MSNKVLEKALNEQLNAEMYSAYLYLSMSAYFSDIGLDGFANWMRVQAKEEQFHAMKFYDYINERGGRVLLTAIEAPKTEWESPLACIEAVLEHEKHVTSLVNDLVNLAIDERDHATNIFLQWFVTEQVEEEDNVNAVLNKLRLLNGEGNGMFILDKELSTRVFNAPAE
ncbi:ferritin [Maridesulfovibrio salexigens]|uniref:Ferritin n=1 Tax=Maridesulfovibrio salexigens (strain ATCC 14822 / DSM 2638 / NCIMB 8403 / VKM B-1763) TaxID=526222 RepID=C6BV15_MARSD|nr:ferritin [Maridesulfovibrio salexigens]ACS78152.1 Ferroxidase [Maridesulfovibrio salexigens DSM 2638]